MKRLIITQDVLRNRYSKRRANSIFGKTNRVVWKNKSKFVA